MRLILDRIEESMAVFENPETQDVSNFNKSLLPLSAKEGDVFDYDSETHTFVFDPEATSKRRQIINDLANQLFS